MTLIRRRLDHWCKPIVRSTIAAVASIFLIGGLIGSALSQEKTEAFADGDVLKITAIGQEDLTGQYTVQPGTVLSLPLIGPVELAGRTPRQLEESLSKDWENRVGSPISVTVEFVERAPFFILGAVRSPGMYPSRSGLTVLQALAIGGGIDKLDSPDARLRMDVLREHERRIQAIERMAQATAARARLLAERDGKKEIEFPASFTLVSKSRMTELIAEQQKLLDARNEQNTLKESLFTEQITLGEAEMGSYQEQYNALTKQASLINKEVTRVRRVPGQLVRSFELQQRKATLEASAVVAEANIAHVKANVATARNGISAMREENLQEISEALIKQDEALSESSATEQFAARILQGLGLNSTEQYPEFKLLRQGSTEYIAAGPSTLVRAGDVLDVFMPIRPTKSNPKEVSSSDVSAIAGQPAPQDVQ